MVTKVEADSFDILRDEPPFTADDFKLYLEGTCGHAWNKAATRVFGESFCRTYPQHGREEAEDHFKTHLDTLIRKYRHQKEVAGDSGALNLSRQKSRQSSRRSTVSPLASIENYGYGVLNLIAYSSLRIARTRYEPSQN